MSGLSPAQIEERRQGITATDVAAIVGVHPYTSVIDVWLAKLGRARAHDAGRFAAWGNRVEGPIREDYAERHGVRVLVPGTLTHPEHEHHRATPDGIVYPWHDHRPLRGLEIKKHGFYVAMCGYGEPGTDEVPEYELIQCAWGMHVTGIDRWDLAVCIDGPPVDYVIHRDAELDQMMVEAVDRFWIDHVQGQREPEPDGHERYSEWLRDRYPTHREGVIVDADDRAVRAIELYRALREQQRRGATAMDIARQEIESAIGDAEGITAALDDGLAQITWKRAKDSERVDWRAVAAALGEPMTAATSSPTLCDLLACLESWSTTAKVMGNDGAPAVTAGDVVESLRLLLDAPAVEQIIKKHTAAVPGTRRFLVPRSWK